MALGRARSPSKAKPVIPSSLTSRPYTVLNRTMSDKPRPIFINRYRRTDDFVIIGGTTTANRAEAEKRAAAAEEAKKSNSDRGLMLRGFRPFAA